MAMNYIRRNWIINPSVIEALCEQWPALSREKVIELENLAAMSQAFRELYLQNGDGLYHVHLHKEDNLRGFIDFRGKP